MILSNTLIKQRFHKLLNSASPRAISQIITLGFTTRNSFSYLHSAMSRAISFRIAFYAVKLALILYKQNDLIKAIKKLQSCYVMYIQHKVCGGVPQLCSLQLYRLESILVSGS